MPSLRTANKRRWRSDNRPDMTVGYYFAITLGADGIKMARALMTFRGGVEVRHTQKAT